MDTPEPKRVKSPICDADIPATSANPYPKSLRPRGPAIREFRRRLRLTQAEIAFEADTTQGRISDAENERCETLTTTLLKLAAFFQVELDKVAHVVIDSDKSDGNIRSGAADVLRYLFSFDDDESIAETFNEYRSLVDSKRDAPQLQTYHRLTQENRLAVWSKLEQEGWSRIFTDASNMERQLQSWTGSPALLAEILRHAHIDNTFAVSREMVDLVSESIDDLISYHSRLGEDLPANAVSKAIRPISELLAERVEFLLSRQVSSLEDVEDFCDALLSCDLSITGQNRGLSRVVCEVHPSIVALLRFLFLRDVDENKDGSFELMRGLLTAMQKDQLSVYQQLATGEPFAWSIEMWCQSRNKMISLMSHTIVLNGAVDHRMFGISTTTAFRTEWFQSYVSSSLASFALIVWDIIGKP